MANNIDNTNKMWDYSNHTEEQDRNYVETEETQKDKNNNKPASFSDVMQEQMSNSQKKAGEEMSHNAEDKYNEQQRQAQQLKADKEADRLETDSKAESLKTAVENNVNNIYNRIKNGKMRFSFVEDANNYTIDDFRYDLLDDNNLTELADVVCDKSSKFRKSVEQGQLSRAEAVNYIKSRYNISPTNVKSDKYNDVNSQVTYKADFSNKKFTPAMRGTTEEQIQAYDKKLAENEISYDNSKGEFVFNGGKWGDDYSYYNTLSESANEIKKAYEKQQVIISNQAAWYQAMQNFDQQETMAKQLYDDVDKQIKDLQYKYTKADWIGTHSSPTLEKMTTKDYKEDDKGNVISGEAISGSLWRTIHNYKEKIDTAISASKKGDGFWKSFGSGFVAGVTDIDTWTAGITSAQDAKVLGGVLDKYITLMEFLDKGNTMEMAKQRGLILNDGEQMLVDLALKKFEIEALSQDMTSMYYNAGSIAGISAGMMAEFALTGGLAGGIKSGAKALTTTALKGMSLGRKLLYSAYKRGRQLSGLTGFKGQAVKAGKAIGDTVIGGALQTVVSPHGYMAMQEAEQTHINEQGQIEQVSELEKEEAAVSNFLDVLTEYQSERSGETFRALGSLITSPLKNTPFGKMMNYLSNNKAIKLLTRPTKGVSKMTGVGGLTEELMEEWAGNEARHRIYKITDEEEYNRFFEQESIEEMVVGMALSVGAQSMLTRGVAVANANAQYANALQEVQAIIGDNERANLLIQDRIGQIETASEAKSVARAIVDNVLGANAPIDKKVDLLYKTLNLISSDIGKRIAWGTIDTESDEYQDNRWSAGRQTKSALNDEAREKLESSGKLEVAQRYAEENHVDLYRVENLLNSEVSNEVQTVIEAERIAEEQVSTEREEVSKLSRKDNTVTEVSLPNGEVGYLVSDNAIVQDEMGNYVFPTSGIAEVMTRSGVRQVNTDDLRVDDHYDVDARIEERKQTIKDYIVLSETYRNNDMVKDASGNMFSIIHNPSDMTISLQNENGVTTMTFEEFAEGMQNGMFIPIVKNGMEVELDGKKYNIIGRTSNFVNNTNENRYVLEGTNEQGESEYVTSSTNSVIDSILNNNTQTQGRTQSDQEQEDSTEENKETQSVKSNGRELIESLGFERALASVVKTKNDKQVELETLRAQNGLIDVTDPEAIANEKKRKDEMARLQGLINNLDDTLNDIRNYAYENNLINEYNSTISETIGQQSEKNEETEEIDKTESEKIRERLLELSEQFGVDVVVYENEDEIEHEVAKDAVRNGDLVEAYTTGNKVYFVASSFIGRGGIRRAEEVFVHEVVVHIGLEKLLGDKWTQFRRYIWQKMNEHEQGVFMEYARGTNSDMSKDELQLLAADEYLAHLSERFASDVLTPHEASVFDEIINFFMQIMETLGIRLSNQQCKTIFVASAQAMRETKESRDKANTESKPKETKDQTESKPKEKSDKEVKEKGNKENAKPKKRTDEVENKPKREQTEEPNKGEKRSKASRSTTDVEQVNDRFNTELQRQIDGTLPKGHVYQLGMPSEILRSAGIPNLPIVFQASRLKEMSMKEKFAFELGEIENMPNAVRSPLAVIRYKDSNVIFTELKYNGKNVIVGLLVRANTKNIKVEEIRLHSSKDAMDIINWFDMSIVEPTYVDKARMLKFMNEQKDALISNHVNPNYAEKVFNSAKDKITNFENPKLESDNNSIRFSKIDPMSEYADNEKIMWLHEVDKNGGLIMTDETRTDDNYDEEDVSYNQQFAYKPVYLKAFYYADNTNPQIEEYSTIEEALNNMETMGYTGDMSDYYEPYNELRVLFQEVWVDSEGWICEEGDVKDIERCYDYDFKDTPLGEYSESIYSVSFEAKQNEIDEYFDEVKNSLIELLDGYIGELDEEKVHLKRGKYLNKYNTIEVVNDNGDIKGNIQLRIANHSYNPLNNDNSAREGNFISLVLSDNDPTQHKFNGRFNLRHGIGDDVQEVCDDVEKRIDEILSDWDSFDNRARFSISKNEEEFKATQRQAVEEKGIVMSGLNNAIVNVVDVPRHDFTGRGIDAIHKAEDWSNKNIVGEHIYHKGQEDEFKYTIDKEAIGKFLSKSSTTESDNLGVHLAVLKKLPEVIDNSIDVEIHPDYKKVDNKRSADNGVGNEDLLVHRMYGAVSIDGRIYRAKTTIHEFKNKDNRAYDYKITEVKLIVSGSSTSNARTNSTSVSATKILNGVEKSYDKGKKVLEESKNNTRFSRSYHGGSAKFDKFELSHVLSGLGANVSGYGIYLTDIETTARYYASVASKKNADKFAKDSQYMQDLYAEAERIDDKRSYVKSFIYSGSDKGAEITKWLYDLYLDSPVYKLVSDYRKGNLSDTELEEKLSEHVSRDEVFDIISKIKERDNYEANQKLWNRVYDKLSQDYKNVIDKYNFANRHLYSVEIPDDNGKNYLHYGRPMPKEQYDRVRRALLNWKEKNNKDNKMSYIINNAISEYDDKMSNGTKFHWEEIFRYLGSPEGKWLSDALSNEGFVGYKIPDYSKQGKDNERIGKYINVIFKEDDVKIVEHIRFSRKEEVEKYANDLRFCAKKDLKTFPTLYKVAEKYWNDNKHKMSKMVNDAKSVDALVDLLDALYNGLMEEYFLSKAEVNPNRVRHEIAQLKNTDPNTLRSILNAKGIDYKDNVDDYTNDELREIGSGISDVLTEKRRAVGEQWKEVLERENVPTRYLVLRSLLQYISKNKEAVPVNYLEGAFVKTMDRFNESANPTSFNFYAEYNKSIAEVLFEDTDNVIEISREEGNGISGKWGRMKKQSESADVEETKAKVSAISYNTSWCTKHANVDGTGAKKVIEEDNHDFYVFVKDGETTGTMAIVPIREEEGEDVLKNNPWYTGIFKQSNGSDNSIEPEYFDVVNALARKAKDTDLVRTLDLMGYNGMTKEEMAELQRQKNAKQTEWLNSHDVITEADFADINDMFGILLRKNGDDVVLHELTQGIYEQPNEEIRDLFWEKVGGIINIITGEITLEGNTQLTLPNLTSIGGRVEINDNVQLTLPNLTRVGRDVETNKNSQLTLPNLTSIGGSVATYDNSQLTLPNVTSVGGSVVTRDNSQLTLPNLTSIKNSVVTNDNSQLTLPNVTSVGGGVVTRDNSQLTLPNLTSIGRNVETRENSQLTLSNVTNIGGNVTTNGNSQLTLPNVTYIGGDVETNKNSQLTLPNVTSVGGSVITRNDSQLTLPNVTNIGDSVIIRGNSRLTLPNLTSVGGYVETNDNSQLTLPNLTSIKNSVVTNDNSQLTLPNVTNIGGFVETNDDSQLTLPSSMQDEYEGNITWVDNTRFSRTREEIERELADIKAKAIADGTFMKAPNGKMSNLGERQWLHVRLKSFKKWFGDWEKITFDEDGKVLNIPDDVSKVVDENGEPMEVYHYTPNEFTEFDRDKIGSSTDVGAFGRGFYLSPSDKFSRYGSNKMSLFVNARNPLMLNYENAFEAKEPYYKSGYRWDTETSQRFTEAVQTQGYDAVYFENLAMDEVVVFNPNQIKSSTDNIGTYDGENGDIRFSVSRDNNLIAVHNLSEYNMRRVIDMGALVMPSIAITNTKIGHTSFGDISLLFGKDTIDPSDRRNKVYGGDAWTPRFPHLEPKINESVADGFRKKIYDLFSDTRLRDLYHISSEVHEDSISDNIRSGGVERYYNKEFMKHAYLLDKGKKVDIPMKMKDYGEYSDVVIDLVKTKGLSLSDIYSYASDVYTNNKDFVNELHERIIDIKVSSMSISEVEKEKVRGLLRKKGMTFAYFDRLVENAYFKERDLKYGSVEIVDRKALLDDVNSRVNSNNANYRKWVNDLFDGIIEKYGIRNNKDWYTPSGTQRSWETLYDNVTPSNILKHMLSKSQQGGQGFFNSSIFGASAEEYSSIEEIREKGKERLQKEDEEVYEEWSNSVLNRLSDIGNEVMSRNSSLYDIDNFNQRIIDAVSKKKIASGIYKEVKRFYPKFTMSHAKQVEDIVKEIQAHAIGYFEAKPQRIVSLSEVAKAVVPTGTSADIIDGLKGYGVEVVTYRRGNDNAHKRAIERASKDIRFSKKFNRDNIAEVVYRNRMIIDYNRYVFENRPRGILKPHYGYIDEDRLEEYKAFYQDIKNKADDLKTYLKEDIMTDATSGAKSFINEYIAKIDRQVDAYRRLSENDNSVLNEYLRFSRSNANQEIFISNAERAVEGIKQDKATPEQWLKMIEKQGGLKAGEDKWLGLSDWLKANDKKSITKQEILDFIGENKIRIEEVEYAEEQILSPNSIENLESTVQLALLSGESIEDGLSSWDDVFGDNMLEAYKNGTIRIDEEGNVTTSENLASPINSTRLDYTTLGLKNNREIALTVPTIESWNEDDDVHFGDAGEGRAVAWIRFGETTDSDGNSVLVIDEIQSKRHQEGREKGYQKNVKLGEYIITNKAGYQTLRHEVPVAEVKDEEGNVVAHIVNDNRVGNRYHVVTPLNTSRPYLSEEEALRRARRATNVGSLIPSAPFEKNWHELAMKRMLRLAAEEGYDKVAWTKGEQQAERYNIGNVVNGIDANPPDADFEYTQVLVYNDGVTLEMDVDKDGKIVKGHESASQEYEGKNLSEVVGKENAIKLLTGEEVKLRGENFRLGGEGMIGFYDEILPRFMNKYGKKWGTKVEDVKLPKVEEAGRVMHSVAVTEEMRESVMEGQVMFSRKRGNDNRLSDDTRFSRKMGEAKAQLADMKYGETVRMDALAQAKAMFLQGEPMEDIFAQTGWKQQNMFGKPTWRYTEADLSAREKLDRFLKADRKSEIEMLTLGNKKLSELRAMLGNTINMKTFKSKLQEVGKSEKEVREDLADLLETFGKSMPEGSKRFVQTLINALNTPTKDFTEERLARIAMGSYAQVLQENDKKTKERIADLLDSKQGVASDAIENIKAFVNSVKTETEAKDYLDVEYNKAIVAGDIAKATCYQLARRAIDAILSNKGNLFKPESFHKALKDFERGNVSSADVLSMITQLEDRCQTNAMIEQLLSNINDIGEAIIEDAIAVREQKKAEVISDFLSDMSNVSSSVNAREGRRFYQRAGLNVIPESAWKGLISPDMTLDTYLRRMSSHHTISGEGRAWSSVMKMFKDCRDQEIERHNLIIEDTLKNKIKEIFDTDSIHKLQDLCNIDSDIVFEVKDKGTQRVIDKMKLTNGQCLMLYLWSKQADSQPRFNATGVTSALIDEIENYLSTDPIGQKLKAFGEWTTQDFLPRLREDYRKDYEIRNNKAMPIVENYFPYRAGASDRSLENASLDSNGNLNTSAPSSFNDRAEMSELDIAHNDFLSILNGYLTESENEHNWGEFKDVLLAVLRNPDVKKKTDNMYNGAYHDMLTVFQNTVRQEPSQGLWESVGVGVIQSVASSKIGFKLFTALKQTTGLATLNLHEEGVSKALSKNLSNLHATWEWAMINSPILLERWKRKQMGNEALAGMDKFNNLYEDGIRRKKLVRGFVKTRKVAMNVSMYPNAFIDAVVCAVVMKTIYDARMQRFDKMYGSDLSNEKKRDRALLEAVMFYNATQQSNERAFMSAPQLSRNFFTRMLMMFGNATFAMGRRATQLGRDIRNMTSKARREAIKEEFKERYKQETGVDDINILNAKADKFMRWQIRDVCFARPLAMMAYVSAFPIMTAGVTELVGLMRYDDGDDEEKSFWQQFFEHVASLSAGESLGTMLMGSTLFGNIGVSAFGELFRWLASDVDGDEYNFNKMSTPNFIEDTAMQHYRRIAESIENKDGGQAIYMAVDMAMELGLGVDLDVLANIIQSVTWLITEEDMDATDVMYTTYQFMNMPERAKKKLATTLRESNGAPDVLKTLKRGMSYYSNLRRRGIMQVKSSEWADLVDELFVQMVGYEASNDVHNAITKNMSKDEVEGAKDKNNAPDVVNETLKKILNDKNINITNRLAQALSYLDSKGITAKDIANKKISDDDKYYLKKLGKPSDEILETEYKFNLPLHGIYGSPKERQEEVNNTTE